MSVQVLAHLFLLIAQLICLSALGEPKHDGHRQALHVASDETVDDSARLRQTVTQQSSINSHSKQSLHKLAENSDCADDIQRFCKHSNVHNFAIFQCLTDESKDDGIVSSECQHVLWQYKLNLTKDAKFESATTSVCADDLKNIHECAGLEQKRGFIIPCLIYYIDNITKTACHEFLQRMESFVFSDYQLIHRFTDECESDINKWQCGRLMGKNYNKLHDQQGRTLSCLVEHASDLSPQCQHELLRVAELQADDYHKDRQLYLACREDREIFCPKIGAGSGKIYKCLYEHKFDKQMSSVCRQQLTNRQKLESKDYKVNHGLVVACRQDLVTSNCSEHSSMSNFLGCLDKAASRGLKLTVECAIELKSVRRNVLEDYQISPEIASHCDNEIVNYCHGVGRRETVHCLMDLARQRNHSLINLRCRQKLTGLVGDANIVGDYSVDLVLQEACHAVVRSYCADIQNEEESIYSCLMNAIDKPRMNPDCAKKLLQVHYFVSRNFRLNPKFYKECSEEKQHVCYIQNDSVKDQAQTLSCLYEKLKEKGDLPEACIVELKIVMSERAKSVELEPEIEDACLEDLAKHCSTKTKRNEEMDCLEDNLETLTQSCKEVVEQYIKNVDIMPQLDNLFAAACEPFWKVHCLEAAKSDKGDSEPGSLMSCLIQFKNDVDMPPKCRAGIEHHQLITMSADFKISRAFQLACQHDVKMLCHPDGEKLTKSTVIDCLSSIVRSDSLQDQTQRVTNDCRSQLKFELLQRSEDIVLDPKLKEACQRDIRDYCSTVHQGQSRVIECLQNNAAKLQLACHQMLFTRELEEAQDPTTDYKLMSKCKKMIKKHCLDDMSSSEKIFSCLLKHKEEDEDFDEGCIQVLVKRLRVRAHDIRLNPDLLKFCKKDIYGHCKTELDEVNQKAFEAEGKVLFCLRRFFAQKKLTSTCSEHVSQLIKESVLDYVQDVRLAMACANEIKQDCADAAEAEKNDEYGGKGQVEDCLKHKFLLQTDSKKFSSNCVQELVRSMAENKADVHVDPVLFRACYLDIKGYCRDVVRGEGRQMSCLISALEDSNYRLQASCRNELKARVDLWSVAVKLAPPDNFHDLMSQVYESNSSSYLLVVIAGVIACIFVGGLFCGRVTKRLGRPVKYK